MSHTPTEVTIKARFRIYEERSEVNPKSTLWYVVVNGEPLEVRRTSRESALSLIESTFNVSPEHVAQYPL